MLIISVGNATLFKLLALEMTYSLLGSGPDHPDHPQHGAGGGEGTEDGTSSERVWNNKMVPYPDIYDYTIRYYYANMGYLTKYCVLVTCATRPWAPKH